MRDTIKDWRGKVLGFIDTYSNGDKVIRDFNLRILGRYDKKLDVTKDFYGRVLAKGDQLPMLLSQAKN